jgi:hypothetical protein
MDSFVPVPDQPDAASPEAAARDKLLVRLDRLGVLARSWLRQRRPAVCRFPTPDAFPQGEGRLLCVPWWGWAGERRGMGEGRGR